MVHVSWNFLAYDITSFLLACCYLLLLILGPVLYLNSMDPHFRRRFNSLAFIITFECGIIVRGGYFAIQPLIRENRFQIANSINFLLNTSPSFFFFSTYMVLLLMWSEVYTTSYDGGEEGSSDDFLQLVREGSWKTRRVLTLRRGLIIANMLMYTFVCIIYCIDLYSEGVSTEDFIKISTANSHFEITIIIFTAIMYITTTLGFFVYGYFVYKNKFHARGIARSQHQGKLLRKIGLLGIICMFCFMVRAFLTLIQIAVSVISQTWWIISIYYLALEIFPLTLMLIVLITVNVEPKNRLVNHPNAKTPLIS